MSAAKVLKTAASSGCWLALTSRPRSHGREVGGRLALQGFEHILEAASVAETEDRRQVEWKHDGALDRGQLRPQTRDDGVDGLRSSGSLFIGLQPNDEEGLVRRSDIVDEIEADHRHDALHAGNWSDDVLDLRDQLLGAVERGALRQPHRGKECALILRRQESPAG